MMKKTILISGLLGAAFLLDAGDIRYEKGADKAVQFAAKDLARCLSEVCGEKYGVQTEGKAVKGDIVLSTDPKLKTQEWKFKTEKGILTISGSGSPGIVYGVFTFLEKYVGCFWPAPDTEILPKQPGWKLPEVDETGRPAFLRREMYVGTDYMDSTWRQRNKENNRAAFITLRVGKPKECHTFDVYVKAVKDPSLFGVTPSGQPCRTLCMTNPKVREIILKQLTEYIEADRKAAKGQPDYCRPQIYDISQPDGGSGAECWCDGCRKLAEEEGSYAGPNIAFVNYLADAVKDKYPDILLRTFAYSYTMKPPKTIKAADNVVVQFCDSHIFRPLVPGTPNGRDLEIWGKHASKKSIWSYWRTYNGSLFPFVRPRKDISDELRFCSREGVIHYFAENEMPLSRSFAMQQHWLMLKMLDDPEQDIFKLNDKFFEAYYGKGAAPMLKYLDYLEKRQNARRTHLDPDFFTKVNEWLDEAEELAKDDPRSLVHIGWERVIVDRSMYHHLADLEKQGFRTDLKKTAARFRKNILAQVKHWTPLKRYLNTRLPAAEQEADLYSHFPVKIPEQFDGCEVIDMHWTQLNGQPVKDPDAVCGTARINPKYRHKQPYYDIGYYNGKSKEGNGIKFGREDFPQDEKFHLYRIGRTLIMTPAYIRYDNTWTFRQWLSPIGLLGEVRDIWVSMKFTGPLYVKGSKNKNMVLFDRVLLVKDPNPLRHYKPIDPAKNLLTNGGFEKYKGTWMEQWGKSVPKCGIDTEVKHSGKASLRVMDMEKGSISAKANLGKVADLKHDLLIRGWVKYKDITDGPKLMKPIFSLWTVNEKGRNSYALPLLEFFSGSYDWYYFETIVDIEQFKKACRRHPVNAHTVQLRIGLYHQPGTVWADDLEIIPLEKNELSTVDK